MLLGLVSNAAAALCADYTNVFNASIECTLSTKRFDKTAFSMNSLNIAETKS